MLYRCKALNISTRDFGMGEVSFFLQNIYNKDSLMGLQKKEWGWDKRSGRPTHGEIIKKKLADSLSSS